LQNFYRAGIFYKIIIKLINFITKFNRTDNAIKNHFYSKLRKFIRKMLKQLNKENLLKANSIDVNKYNSDYVYKIIKKNKIPYNNLNKDSILSLVINHDKNVKNGKVDSQFLRTKTYRKKMVKNFSSNDNILKVGENMYEEKVIKRKNKNDGEFDNVNAMNVRKNKREGSKFIINSNDSSKRNDRKKRADSEDNRKNSNEEDKVPLCKMK
jgi:hypothetical protein